MPPSKIIAARAGPSAKSKGKAPAQKTESVAADSAIMAEVSGVDEEESDSDEDDEQVDPEAMSKLMDMLGDIDAADLGFTPEDLEDDDDEDDEDEDEDDEEIADEEELDIDEASDDNDDDEELGDPAGDDTSDNEEPDKAALGIPTKPKKGVTSAEQRKQDQILDRILARFKLDVPFFETQTLTYPEPLDIPDVSNDLSRELQFYKQSLWAAQHAYKLFKASDVPFSRPPDYYAEMLKTDDHMERIRQKLLDETAAIKASETAKKQRHLKKFGKQVQVEKQREREKAKRDMDDKVKAFKQKRKGNPGGDNDDFDVEALDNPSKRGSSGRPAKRQRTGKTRDQRDSKFGHAKTGRNPKENDRASANDIFSNGAKAGRSSSGGRGGRGGRGGSRGGGRGGGSAGRGGGRGGKQKRLGKSRRN